MCVIVGKDAEVDSHTPARARDASRSGSAEVRRGPLPYRGKQAFVLNSAGQFQLKSNPKSCIDTDATDKMLELYSCHAPASAGNQAFTLEAATGHIIAKGSGLCMYVRSN